MTNTIQSKHPKALWLIISIYMWEYFSFYGMRALLILYLTQELLLNDTMSYAIYGSYVTLVYMTPIIGGMIADKYIGFKRAVILGAILMACGHLIIGIDGNNLLYLGMAFIICGYGHFKSNIPCLLGEMYEPHDPNRDSAFTLLYLGGNIGGVIAPIACGVVAHLYGWDYGFGLAGIGMIIGLVIFLAGSKHIPEAQKHNVSNKTLLSVLGVSSLIILVCYTALEYQLEGYMLIVATIFCIMYYIKILSSSDAVVKKSLLLLIPFTLFGIIFWVFDEQMYTSVELFISRNVDTTLRGFDIPASVFTSLNPASVIIGGLALAWIWKVFKGLESDFGRMIKFMLGFVFQLLSFLLLILAAKQAISSGGMASAIWVIASLSILGFSELFIDPIALSEITSIKAKNHIGFLAAAYMFFTGSIAGFIGAKVANVAAFKDIGSHGDLITQAQLYHGLFLKITIALAVTVILWFIVSIFIKKSMK